MPPLWRRPQRVNMLPGEARTRLLIRRLLLSPPANTRMSCCRISKQELASPGGTKMVGGVLPPSGDSTYLLREGSGRGQNLLLGLRPQYSSYCSGCHSVTRMLRQGGVFLVIIHVLMVPFTGEKWGFFICLLMFLNGIAYNF
ncbi:hypothetical protein AVEN_223501-1 [Araneus ventricosus]|uniref:Uncharacterized protein n=1 Tax=Araneus ventricosus TaxID=182803 RepID=A0A4Y2DK26_ARAVE|nr:hypothetical protein AVEN_223501-1 [Araneus ventricosus]